MKKRTIAVLLTMAMAATMMAGCGSKSDSKTADGEKSYTIGISQFAEHGSLDNCREGFLEGLKEEGIEEGKNLNVEYKNSAADMGTASQIASSFVSDKVDLICGIATPSAQTAYNAAMDTDISVILYTTSEANSVSAIAEYKEKVGDYGFELVEKGITNTSEIALATDDLLSQVDCISNLTDNTVVSSLATILDKANAANIPVFGSEIEQVKLGCLAAEGLDYVALGKQTGKMAAKVLKGEKKASEMPFETITEAGLYLNTKVAENLGITVEDDLKNSAVETYDSISEN